MWHHSINFDASTVKRSMSSCMVIDGAFDSSGIAIKGDDLLFVGKFLFKMPLICSVVSSDMVPFFVPRFCTKRQTAPIQGTKN